MLVALTTGAGVTAAAVVACGRTVGGRRTPSPSTTSPAPSPTPTPTPTPTPPPDAEFTVVAAGDVLPHIPVDVDARTADGYDFTPEMAPVKNWIDGADIAICHMEVPIAPAGVNRPATRSSAHPASWCRT